MKIKKENLQDVTITHVSYVKRPANKRPFFFAKSEDGVFQTDVRFIEKSEEQQLLYGIVYEPDTEDAHGDSMICTRIEKWLTNLLSFTEILTMSTICALVSVLWLKAT